MAQVHPDAYLQLITGDICPTKSADCYLYKFSGGVVVSREAPHYDLFKISNDLGDEFTELMHPEAEIPPHDTLRVPRAIFEAWLLEGGYPFGVVRDEIYARGQIAAVWGRILPMGSGPATLRLQTHSVAGQLLGVEDRLGQAVAVFTPHPKSNLASQVPDLEGLMKKILAP